MVVAAKRPSNLRPELAAFEELDVDMNQRGYVGAAIMRPFNVGVASDTFPVVKLKSLLANANADTRRQADGSYAEGDYEFDERLYRTKEHGWKEPVDDRLANMYGSVLDVEKYATMRAWAHVLSGLEFRVVKLITTPGEVTQHGEALGDIGTNASDKVWTDPAADIIGAVRQAADDIWARTGVWAQTLTVSRRTFHAMRDNAGILAKIQSAGAGERTLPRDVTLAKMAEALDLDRVVASDSVTNTANRAKKATIASMFPDNKAFLGRTAETDDPQEPCFGRIMHWGGDGSVLSDDLATIGVVDRYRDEDRRRDLIRVRNETDEHIVIPEMGQVITGVR